MPAPTPPAGPATPVAQPGGNAPAAAGMMTPQEPSGEIEAAKLDVYHAVKLLDRAVMRLGKGEDGDIALKARATLTRHFGDHEDASEEFSPSELKRMLTSLLGPGSTGQPNSQAQQPPGGGAPPAPNPAQQ